MKVLIRVLNCVLHDDININTVLLGILQYIPLGILQYIPLGIRLYILQSFLQRIPHGDAYGDVHGDVRRLRRPRWLGGQ